MRASQSPPALKGATPAQVREAERGFKLWLRRRFSAVWIAEHAADLMAQANVEYAEWLEDHPPARNPVGWLLTCAERRAKNMLDSERRRPTSAPLEAVFHLADEATPTPEQQAIEHDRGERLREALSVLPEKECKLLALVYFRDYTIREAGRALGWQKSAADRHHRWALEKLRALVGEDRSLLTPATLGLGAWTIAYGERGRFSAALDGALGPIRQAVAIGLEALGWLGRQLGELGRRVAPITDHASAAASGGGGRLVGACGVAVASVVCGLAASGALPTGGGEEIEPAVPVSGPVQRPASTEPLAPLGGLAPESPPEAPAEPATEATPQSSAAKTPRSSAKRIKAPKATTEQTVSEFGIEGGSAPAPEPSAGSAGEGGQAPAPPSSGSGSSGSSSGGSSGSQVNREFGL